MQLPLKKIVLTVGIFGLSVLTSCWTAPSVSARHGADDMSSSATVTAGDEDHTSSGTDDSTTGTARHKAEELKKEAENLAAEAKGKADDLRKKQQTATDSSSQRGTENATKRLKDTKLKVCQSHQSRTNAVMGRIGERAQKQLELYSNTSSRIQTFKTNKQLTVAGYDQLVADIEAKKIVAQTAIDKVKADKAAFKCDGTDPAGTVELFKADTTAQNEALKAYRAAIKELLVAVKATAGTKATATPTAPTTTSGTGGVR